MSMLGYITARGAVACMEILHCTQYLMAYTIILQGVHKILARPSSRDVKRLSGFDNVMVRNVQSNTRVTCLAAPGHYKVMESG